MSIDLGQASHDEERVEDRGGVLSPGLRGITIAILATVGVIAFESLGVATILPTAARDLGGLGAYGWGMSALMLANIVGTVVAGASIDRHGPLRAVVLGSLVFAVGTALAGCAPSWAVFIAARAVQGIGAGTIMAYAYSLVGLAYPERLQAVMFALLSSAWTIPSLIGPVCAGLITAWLDWRIVFWAIAPATILLLPIVRPCIRRLAIEPPATDARLTTARPTTARRSVLSAVVIAVGTSTFLIGVGTSSVLLALLLTMTGLTATVVALRDVLPAGTFRAARGVPSGLVIRFLLCAVYFGSEAFLPLGLMNVHHLSAVLAGIGLAAGALAWTAGSFLQARLDKNHLDNDHPGHRGRAVIIGALVLVFGEIIMGVTVAGSELWAGWAVIGWAIGGAGMGIAFNAATSATMAQAPRALTGAVSAHLQLAQTLATAVVAGIGGGVIAAIGARTSAFLVIFGLTAALGLAGARLGSRLESRLER